MDRFRHIRESCSANTSKFKAQHWLFIAQFVLVIVLIVYMYNIDKAYKEQQEKWKSLLSAALNESNVNLQDMCVSSVSNDMFKKFQFYKNFIFGIIFSSAIVNLIYLAFAIALPQEKWVLQIFYGPLAAMGIVSMAFAVDGYVKIKSFTKEPIECQKMFNDLKTFFIISTTASALQSFVSIWIIGSLYIKLDTTGRQISKYR